VLACAFSFALVAANVSPSLAQPATDAQKRADTLFGEGQRFLANKEYAVACTAFEQSQALDPAIGTQLNIALCYEQWGHIASAYKAYLEAARIANAANDDRGPRAALRANELKPKVPRLTLVISNPKADPAAAILIDGKEVLKRDLVDILMEPGTHKIEVRAPGKEPASSTITLAQGAREELELDIPAPTTTTTIETVEVSAKRGRVIFGWTLTGLGAVALGAAGYVSLVARQDYRNAFAARCNSMTNECNAAGFRGTSDARRRANIASFVAGGGGALVITGIIVLLTGRKEKKRAESSWYLVPEVSPTSHGFAVGASF
jgi:tetratricopeptide (TPR) repeat protein